MPPSATTTHAPGERATLDLSVLDRYDIHPAAALWPLIGTADLEALADDIATHGLKERISRLDNGQVIDGRNRLVACARAGVEPRFETWKPSHPGEDVVTFIMSKNMHRRHLSASVRATIAVEFEGLIAAENKRRRVEEAQRAAAFSAPEKATVTGKAARPVPGGFSSPEAAVASTAAPNTPKPGSGRARDQAAAALGVSGAYVNDAKDLRNADPETFAQVRAGELTLPRAQEQVVERAQAEGRLDQVGLRPGTVNATVNRIEERKAAKQEPAPRVKIPTFTKVESSRVTLALQVTFGNAEKAEEWLNRMQDDKAVLALDYEAREKPKPTKGATVVK